MKKYGELQADEGPIYDQLIGDEAMRITGRSWVPLFVDRETLDGARAITWAHILGSR